MADRSTSEVVQSHELTPEEYELLQAVVANDQFLEDFIAYEVVKYLSKYRDGYGGITTEATSTVTKDALETCAILGAQHAIILRKYAPGSQAEWIADPNVSSPTSFYEDLEPWLDGDHPAYTLPVGMTFREYLRSMNNG